MKTYTKIIAAVAAGIACSAATSQAAITSISPGQSLVPINPALYTVTGGTVVASLSSAYNFGNGTDIGSLITTVYKNDTANLLGGLTFVYTIALTTGDANGLTVGGFPFLVDIANLSGTGALALQANDNNAGSINFAWADQNAPISLSVVVDTSATTFGGNNGNVQDTFAGNAPIYAPVPEPTTVAAGALMLLPLGLGALRSLRKDRIA